MGGRQANRNISTPYFFHKFSTIYILYVQQKYKSLGPYWCLWPPLCHWPIIICTWVLHLYHFILLMRLCWSIQKFEFLLAFIMLILWSLSIIKGTLNMSPNSKTKCQNIWVSPVRKSTWLSARTNLYTHTHCNLSQ